MSQKAEDEASHLADERVSLLLELGASKDELFTFRAKSSKEKKAMEEAFDEGFDVIFNYGYGCCAFAHNIYGSVPVIPDTSKPLLPEFFINPRCPRLLPQGLLPPIQMQMLERRVRVFQPPKLG